MKNPTLWIVTPQGYGHSQAFDELAISLSEAFREVQGVPAPIVRARPEGETIVLGANLLPHTSDRPPRRSVLFNLEQLTPGSPWWSAAYIDLLRRRPVWDYSAKNVALLKSMGIPATLCEVGYSAALSTIEKSATQDIDVLFCGSMNERRLHIAQGLKAAGVNAVFRFNAYGAERDALIARSKIVLNLHYFESRLFEVVRVSYLLANRCCVVSEAGHDGELERAHDRGVAFAPYAQLVDTCLDLLKNPERRRALSEAGFEIIKSRPQSSYLRAALAGATGFPGEAGASPT